MTVIYIHGVNVRDPRHGELLRESFVRWIFPVLASAEVRPDYLPVFWGDAAADFRWDLASRPRTVLLRQGGPGGFTGIGALREAGAPGPLDRPLAQPEGNGPVLGQAPVGFAPTAAHLSDVPVTERPDFLSDFYLAARPRVGAGDPMVEDPAIAPLAAAASTVASSWDQLICGCETEADRAARLLHALDRVLTGVALLEQGGFADWITRAGETLRRAAVWPADVVGTVAGELRPALNAFVARFLGDVLSYLDRRGTETDPGEVPQRVLAALRHGYERQQTTGEKLVVITHSMGGQLLYDALTCFAPADSALKGLVVDHWISCGAQVSFFAELGLFRGQPDTRGPARLERPRNVAKWTNFFDPNDLVGFVMAPVFDGVTDLQYDTGYGMAFAHTGFLGRPSFFEALAARLRSTT
jgi:hypothetical protein